MVAKRCYFIFPTPGSVSFSLYYHDYVHSNVLTTACAAVSAASESIFALFVFSLDFCVVFGFVPFHTRRCMALFCIAFITMNLCQPTRSKTVDVGYTVFVSVHFIFLLSQYS